MLHLAISTHDRPLYVKALRAFGCQQELLLEQKSIDEIDENSDEYLRSMSEISRAFCLAHDVEELHENTAPEKTIKAQAVPA